MHRRSFLSTSAAALAASLLPAARGHGTRTASVVGIQLYTVRRLMTTDATGTLSALAQIGYQEVELAGLYGRTPKDFRKLLDDHGLRAPASHIGSADLRQKREKVFDDALTLGHHWVIVPWVDAADRTPEGIRKLADLLNESGAAAAREGLRIGYHNHEFEFKPAAGSTEILFDTLLSRTDPKLVDFELDLFWIQRGGGDSLAYFTRHPGRFVALHVKDMTRDGKMVNVGEGSIDFAGLFAHADRAGVKHYFVEHDEPTSPINDARVSFVAVQKLLRVE
ncbi:MAG: sugar phosphate isomerase/epimerase family protein [Longimicrobiales bacterium]